MEMVAASKMRKAQDRMRAGRPYALKVREIAAHLMQAHPDYTHPYMIERSEVRAVGVVVVTTDKGLCGGLNTNIMRVVLARLKEFEQKGIKTQFTAFGNKGVGTLARIRANLVSQDVQLGDKPNLERLIGAIKVQLDDFVDGKIDAVYLATNRFVNTMKQDPSFVRLLPLPSGLSDPFQSEAYNAEAEAKKIESKYGWDYIYEPDSRTVIDELLLRYVEGLVYQAVAENMASEQSARMVAMKAASDNAKKVIGDLQLVYNKTRQAAITKEISEIVGGAAAV
jgi:F-type H+-transporting ATPase subunit gamma